MLRTITARGLLVAIISILNLQQSIASATPEEFKEPSTNTLHQKIYPLSTSDVKVFTQNFLTTYFTEAESNSMKCLEPGEDLLNHNTVVSLFINDPVFLAAEKPKISIDNQAYSVTSLVFDSVPDDNSQMGNPPTWRYALGDIIQSWEDWNFQLERDRLNTNTDVIVPFCVHLYLKNGQAQSENIGWMLKIFTEPLAGPDNYQTVDDHSKNLTELFVRFGLFQEKKYLPETPDAAASQTSAETLPKSSTAGGSQAAAASPQLRGCYL